MKGINCLFRNTALKIQLQKLVEHMGYDRAANGKDASVHSIYNELRKAGVEVDLRTVGQLYADTLPLHDASFTPLHEIDNITGHSFKVRVRNLMLMKPKEGENQIGKQSPGEHVAGRLADTFYNNIVEDHTTNSTMVVLRDAVMTAVERLSGELPNKRTAEPKEDFKDTVARYIDQEKNQGYNTLENKLNNIHSVMKETLTELDRYSNEIGRGHDPILKEQWADYIKTIEDAAHSVLFSRKDAQNVLYGALKDGGFGKTVNGKTIVDWDKLAGNINDVHQLRDHVKEVMKHQGYDAGTADRIADSLHQEYSDLKGRILESNMRKFDALQVANQKGKGKLPRMEVTDMIDKRLTEWENFRKLSQDPTKPLLFNRKEAKEILVKALKEEGYAKVLTNGKIVLDWTRLSRDSKSNDVLKSKVQDMLKAQGYELGERIRIANALDGMYTEMRQEIVDKATAKLNSLQDSIGKETPGARTDLERLAELHDLGLFDGNYQQLLNHRLGIDHASAQDMSDLREVAKRASDLSAELGGKNYLGTFAFSNFQRQIEQILTRNLNSRHGMLKATKMLNNLFGFVNMGIIGNPYNLMENNFSGYKELLSANENVLKQMGGEGTFGDAALWRAVWSDVAKGGVEYGDAGEKLAHVADFTSKLNSVNFKKNPVKALATAAIIMPRALLNGSDAAYKAVLHKKSMMLALHSALTQSNGMTKQEATHFIHEALYGENFEQAKTKAGDILDRYNLKNNDATRTRLANDLVVANLNTEGLITEDVLKAGIRAGFDVAAIGLGHEANNAISKMIHAGKVNGNLEEKEMIKNGEFGKAAAKRMWNGLFYNGIMRFMGGGMNWAVLRMHGTGIGIATGYAGDFNRELDFESPASLERTMRYRLKANREITRGVTGASVAALSLGLLYAYGMGKKKEDEDAMQAAFRNVKEGYASNRLMTKLGPDMTMLYYLMETSKGKGTAAAIDGATEYTKNVLNIGTQYTLEGKIAKIGDEVRKGPKGVMKAQGDIGSIAGDMVSVPFYRSAKNFYQIINYWSTGTPIESKWKQPMSVWDGMFGGGLLEDMGVYHRNAPIEVIPGVGNKKAEEFRKLGIDKVEDLKNHPGWEKRIDKKHRDKAVKMYKDVVDEPVNVE